MAILTSAVKVLVHVYRLPVSLLSIEKQDSSFEDFSNDRDPSSL